MDELSQKDIDFLMSGITEGEEQGGENSKESGRPTEAVDFKDEYSSVELSSVAEEERAKVGDSAGELKGHIEHELESSGLNPELQEEVKAGTTKIIDRDQDATLKEISDIAEGGDLSKTDKNDLAEEWARTLAGMDTDPEGGESVENGANENMGWPSFNVLEMSQQKLVLDLIKRHNRGEDISGENDGFGLKIVDYYSKNYPKELAWLKEFEEEQAENRNYLEEEETEFSGESGAEGNVGEDEFEDEKNTIEDKFSDDFSITQNDLENLGFSSLTEGQKLLVYENLRQLTLADIKESANIDFRNKMGDLAISKEEKEAEKKEKGRFISGINGLGRWLKRAGLGITKNFRIAVSEKAYAHAVAEGGYDKYEKPLKYLIGIVKDLDVDEKDGETNIKFFKGFNEEDLGEEQKEAAEEFNKIASDFSKLPEEWSFSTASDKNREKYKQVEERYEIAKEKVLNSFSRDGKKAFLAANKADHLVKMNQFFNSNPEVEKELERIKNQSALWKGIDNVATERGAYFSIGYASRAASVKLLTMAGAAISLPVSIATGAGIAIGAGIAGGYFGNKRANKELIEREMMSRKGFKDQSDEAKDFDTAENLNEKLELLIDKVNNPEKYALELQRKRQLMLDNHRINFTNDFSSAPGMENMPKIKNDEIEKRIYDKLYEDIAPEMIRNKALAQLKTRIDFTKRKMDEGRVNYGSKEEAIINRYNLIQTLSNAEIDSYINGGERNLFIERRLDRFIGRRERTIAKKEDQYKNKQMLLGASLGAVFGTAGYSARWLAGNWFDWDHKAELKTQGDDKTGEPLENKSHPGKITKSSENPAKTSRQNSGNSEPTLPKVTETAADRNQIAKEVTEQLKVYIKEKGHSPEEIKGLAQKIWQYNLQPSAKGGPVPEEIMTAVRQIEDNFSADQLAVRDSLEALKNTVGVNEKIKILESITAKQEQWPGRLLINDANATTQLDMLNQMKKIANGVSIQETNMPINEYDKASLAGDVEKIKSDFTKLAFSNDPREQNELVEEINLIVNTWGGKIAFSQEITDQLEALNSSSHGLHDNFEIILGKNGVPAETERVFSAIVADSMKDILGANGKFSEEEASKILNCAGNLRALIEQHKGVAGITPDEMEKICTLENGKLTINNYQEFNNTINRLIEHSDELWNKGVMQKGGATAYLDNIRQETWLNKIIHADGMDEYIQGHDDIEKENMIDFKDSKMVDDAKEILHKGRAGAGRGSKDLDIVITETGEKFGEQAIPGADSDINAEINPKEIFTNDLVYRGEHGRVVTISKDTLADYYSDMDCDGLDQPNHLYLESTGVHQGIHSDDLNMEESLMERQLKDLVAEIKTDQDFREPEAGEKIGHYIEEYNKFKQTGIKTDMVSSSAEHSYQLKIAGNEYNLPRGVEVSGEAGNKLTFRLANNVIEGKVSQIKGDLIFKGFYNGEKISQNLKFLIEEMAILKEGKYSFDLNSLKPGDIIVGDNKNGENFIYRFINNKKHFECVSSRFRHYDPIPGKVFEEYMHEKESILVSSSHHDKITQGQKVSDLIKSIGAAKKIK